MTTKSPMNFRTTYILGGIVAVLLGVLAIYVFFGDETKPNPEGFLLETFHSLSVKPEEITSLEIEKAGEKMVFNRRSDGRWRIAQPIEARADSDIVDAIVRQLLIVRKEEKGADVTPNLGVHGLDNPPVKITLRKGDRAEMLSLGKVTVGGDRAVVYVLTSDRPKKPQATRLLPLSALFKEKPPENADVAGMVHDFDEFRTKKLLGEGIEVAGAENLVRGIRITVDKKDVQISRENPDRIWRFVSPANYGDVELQVPPDHKLNEAVIESLPQLIKTALSIEVPKAEDFLADARDLAAVGLDPSSPGVMRIDIDRPDAIGTETLWIGTGSKSSAKKELDKVYVRYEGDSSIAQVNGEKARILKRFLDDPFALRDRTLVKLRADRVDAIDVTIDKKTFELRKIAGKRWKVYADDGKTPKVNDANYDAIELLIHQLTQPRLATGFPPEIAKDADLGLDDPKATIRIWEDGVLPAEKPDDRPKVKPMPTVRIDLGNKDVAFARRTTGALITVMKIPDNVRTTAARGRLDYVNISLKPLDVTQVEKIFVPRADGVYEIDRVDPAKPFELSTWKINAPEAKKGKFANADKVRQLLSALFRMKPIKVVIEKPDATQLGVYGLDAAKIAKNIPVVLTLKIKGETLDRVYYFGNTVANEINIFARTSMSDFMFTAPQAIPEIATLGEIVDPTLYQIDPALVKGLKLKGWVDSSANGQPQLLELERISGIWTAKGNLVIDGNKVEEFLHAIAKPKYETVIVEKTGPKPEHGLDVNNGALEVEIDLGDGKPITLTLGSPVGKDSKSLYVQTSQMKGDVFTMKGETLLPIKVKPTVFKK